jgi:tryptophan 7-halogenase
LRNAGRSMTTRAGQIGSILVVGGGIVGWSAAALLKRRAPRLAVAIVPLDTPPDALADRIGSALPSTLEFHRELGLSEADAVLRVGGSYRLGTTFAGWTGGSSRYVHGYGRHGLPFGASSFHLHWVRQAATSRAARFDRHSPAALLAQAGRLPPLGDAGPLAAAEAGLNLDVPRYLAMLRAFAFHCGVVEHMSPCVVPRLDPADGFIEEVSLADGKLLGADLFVDCTGPRALLRGALDDRRDDWSKWLPCDRVAVGNHVPAPSLLDDVVAVANGWRWRAAGSEGTVYSSHFGSDAGFAADAVTIAAGTRPEPWRLNCVAIGDAATALEPLEWGNLHLAHRAILRLSTMLPGRDCARVELAEYNRQTHSEAERARDFVALHYAVSARPEPFWREIAGLALPPSLAHSLTLFRERGRLPVYEEEPFDRDSWLAVLLGQDVLPRRVDPLVETLPVSQVAETLAGFRAALEAAVADAPTQAAYLAAQTRRATR